MKSKNMKIMGRLFVAAFIIMAFSGFGQMPIFKRYYVSDIPGFAWSADYYATHYIHYLGAIFLLGFFAYAAFDYFLSGKKAYSLTGSAYVRLILLTGIVVTGVFRVLKNLPDVVFSPQFTLFFDVAHLGFMMLYLLLAAAFLLLKSGWVTPKTGS
jgi:hypothetical protein